jgi:hypothetical protein
MDTCPYNNPECAKRAEAGGEPSECADCGAHRCITWASMLYYRPERGVCRLYCPGCGPRPVAYDVEMHAHRSKDPSRRIAAFTRAAKRAYAKVTDTAVVCNHLVARVHMLEEDAPGLLALRMVASMRRPPKPDLRAFA